MDFSSTQYKLQSILVKVSLSKYWLLECQVHKYTVRLLYN